MLRSSTMPIRVYVAGSSLEVERAEKWIKRLRERGIVVTSSWPEVVRLNGANPRSAPTPARTRWAHDDLHAVEIADVVWMLVPDQEMPTRGAWAEMGYGYQRATLIFSGDTKQSIFCALGEEHETDEAAFDRILVFAQVHMRGVVAG